MIADVEKLEHGKPVELVVLWARGRDFCCRGPGGRSVYIRAETLWDFAPGETVVFKPLKQWRYAGLHAAGTIMSRHIDAEALGLVPLKLEDYGPWDPEEEYWGEQDQPIPEWARLFIAQGPRQSFEMEQILPGEDVNDPDSDPISNAAELIEMGKNVAARELLMDLCSDDLRCLDAHAHLGYLAFDNMPEAAARHYEVGVRIGELSFGPGFDGVLPWGYVDNRPFLRCLHGFGSCLWRLKRFEEAHRVFARMLRLNPADNQGVRFIVDEVTRKVPWEDRRER